MPIKVLGINYKYIIPIFILIGIFSHYFFENTLMSDGWEILAYRSIDDYAIQASIHNLQKLLLSGNFHKVVTFIDYAYGNAFWV